MNQPEARLTPPSDTETATIGKRILLTTFGSLGDLYPYIAIAVGLKARGHQPVVATSAAYRTIVEDNGIEFTPIRPDLPDPEVIPVLMQTMMDARRGTEEVIRRVVLPALRHSFDDLLVAADGADLLISHLLTYATPLVAEMLDLPWVSTALQPLTFFSAIDPPVVAQAPYLSRLPFLGPWFWRGMRQVLARQTYPWFAPWRALRSELGLPPATYDPLLGGHSSDLVLALFSQLLAQPQPDWPPWTLVTGFPFMASPGGKLAPELESFLASGTAPIVFTLGSSAVMVPGSFYEASADAALRLGRRAVLLTGHSADSRRGSLPDGVIAIDYAPHAALFPRAAAIVHQGGIGTTGEAMRSGRPMLVMPFAHDQFDNARRVERLGIARSIARGRYTGDSAMRELRRLLDDPGYVNRAEAVGQHVRQEDGVGAACDALKALLIKTARA